MRDLDRFIDNVLSAAAAPSSFAVGKVTAYTAGPPRLLSVDWNGTVLTGLQWRKDSTYVPVAGDVVLMARFGAQLVPFAIY